MKLLLTLILLYVSAAIAADGAGFDGISFGLEREKVLDEVFRKGYTPVEQQGQVLVPVYQLGELPVEVVFRFNRSGRFFSYDLRTGAVERERFHKVVEAVRYLSEQLSQRFGAPMRKNFYRIEELQGKKTAQYWVWNHPENDVASFIKTRDARYYTQATVTSKALARER